MRRVARIAEFADTVIRRLGFLNIVRFGCGADCGGSILRAFGGIERVLGFELRPEIFGFFEQRL